MLPVGAADFNNNRKSSRACLNEINNKQSSKQPLAQQSESIITLTAVLVADSGITTQILWNTQVRV